MKKHFLLTKTLLVALLCLVGQSVWATPTTIYERGTTNSWSDADLTDWSASVTNTDFEYKIDGGLYLGNKAPGTWKSSFSATKSIAPTSNSIVTLSATISMGMAANRNTSYDYIKIGGVEFRVYGTGGENNAPISQVYINGIAQGDPVTAVRGGNYVVNIEINQATHNIKYSVSGSSTIAEKNSSSETAITNVEVGHLRGGSEGGTGHHISLTKIDVSEETQTVTNVGYTINYQLSGTTVKTVASTSTVGNAITADIAVNGTEAGYEGKHYLITANEAPSMTLVATAASNVLNVPVRAPYTATLTVTRSVGGVAETPVVTNLIETDAKVCSWSYAYSIYVKKDDVYYLADNIETFGETGTFTDGESINKLVSYTKTNPDIKNFLEAETSVGNNPAYSNGADGYVASLNKYSRGTMLGDFEAGSYMVVAKVTGETGRQLNVRTISTSDNPGSNSNLEGSDIVATLNSALGVQSVVFTLSETKRVIINGQTSGEKTIQSLNFDYVYIIKIPATVPATLGTNGYATFASPYALDLTTANLPSGVTAYKASVSGTTVTFTALNQTVPANTGILLKGTGTVNIPVAAAGTAVEGNDFLVNEGGATFAGDDSYYYFGLVKDSDPLTFRKFVPSTTAIPADKAYLKVLKTSVDATARGLEFVFDDEVTSIGEELRVKSEEFAPAAEFYDLQGRKVAQPTKGLYIVNGRKVIVK